MASSKPFLPEPRQLSTDQLDRRLLWQDETFTLLDDTWTRERHPADRRCHADMPAFVIMRAGSYRRTLGGETGVGDPNNVSLYNTRDEPWRSHPCGDTTAGTTVRVHHELLAELLSELVPDRTLDPRNPFPQLCQPLPPDAYLLCQSLVTHLSESGPKDSLFVEETIVALVRAVITSVYGNPQCSRRRVFGPALRARIPELLEYLNVVCTEEIRFQQLVRFMHCSPWHLSRVFARETGVPLFRYVRNLRLRRALDRILEGATSLSEVSLETGFCSHSHLTRAFRAEFGHAPSRLRGRSSDERIRLVLESFDPGGCGSDAFETEPFPR